MAISVNFNGTTYSIPTTGETGWSSLTNYLRDLGLYAQTTSSQTQAVRTATSSPVTVTSVDYLVVTDLTVAGAVAVNLPIGLSGQIYIILDGKGDAATNNITIAGSSGQTINGAASYVIDANRAGLMLQFVASEWKVIAEFAGAEPHFTNLTITSLSTGVAHVSAAGLLSSSQIVNADVSSSAAIAASKLANTPSGNLSATDVQGALNELQTDVDTRATSAALTTHTGLSSGVHGAVGTVVGTSDSQTLTNKNLASSTNTLTGATAASFSNSGTITLPTGTRTLATLDGTETLTNKTISSSSLIDSTANFADNGDNTKKLALELSGITTATTRTLTVPNFDGTIATLAGVETLTNKTLSASVVSDYKVFTETTAPSTPSAGALRVYAKSDHKLYTKDSNGTETQVGSGAGSGSINYVSNSDFETGATTGWATYADAAATTPVDGTGGSPNVTMAASSSSPLRGTYSGLFTKDAANRQGQGVSYDFTIASPDVSRPLQISFEYTASANFVAADMGVYIYDVTNSVLISPSTVNVVAGSGKFVATFGASTSTSYRLILHVASTNASSYTLKLESVSVGPQVLPNVPAVTDWVSFTPSWTNLTTSASSGFWRRIGDSIHLRVTATSSTTVGGTISIALPNGLTIDTTKSTSSSDKDIFGTAMAEDTSAGAYYQSSVVYQTTTNVAFRPENGGTAAWNATVPFTWANTDTLGFTAIIPVSNWSSSVALTTSNVEYGYSTDTSSTATVTSASALGAEGIQISASWAVGTNYNRRVTFSQPIQPTDSIMVEVSGDGISGAVQNWLNSSSMFPFIQQGTNTYGIKTSLVGDGYSVDVIFRKGGQTPSNGTYALDGSAWSAATNTRWRLKKVSGVQNVPLSGPIYGVIDASNAAGGVIGEIRQEQRVLSSETALTTATTINVTSTTNTGGSAGQLILTPGMWEIHGSVGFDNVGTSVTGLHAAISTTSATLPGTDTYAVRDSNGQKRTSLSFGTANPVTQNTLNVTTYVNISTSTTYYLVAQATFSGGTSCSAYGSIVARRVR